MADNQTWEQFRKNYTSEHASWASNALPVNIKAPGLQRIVSGWTIEQPPHNFFNWHMNRTDNRLVDVEARLAWMALHYQDVPLSLTSLLTLDDADVALSAAGGKALNDRIDGLKEITDKVSSEAGAGLVPTTGDNGKIGKEWLPSTVIPGGIMMFSGTFGGSDGKRPIPAGATEADEGWAICDGTNGTPNLVGRFVVGTGGGYNLGSTGGAASIDARTATHTLTVTATGTVAGKTLAIGNLPAHNHKVTVPAKNEGANQGDWWDGNATKRVKTAYTTTSVGSGSAHNHTFTGSAVSPSGSITIPAHDNRPPYYALAFIMKLPD